MDALSLLETTTEISITLAGFISIFVVLARRDGTFEPGVALLIRLVLTASIMALFASALPLVLSVLGVSGSALWRWVSVPLLVVSVGVSIYVASHRHQIERNFLVPVAVTFNVVVLLLLTVNSAGWPSSPNGGMYAASIWLILGIGSLNFVDLVVHRVLGSPSS